MADPLLLEKPSIKRPRLYDWFASPNYNQDSSDTSPSNYLPVQCRKPKLRLFQIGPASAKQQQINNQTAKLLGGPLKDNLTLNKQELKIDNNVIMENFVRNYSITKRGVQTEQLLDSIPDLGGGDGQVKQELSNLKYMINSISDPEKRTKQHRLLSDLVHAHKCQRMENQADGNQKLCTQPLCSSIKNVLNLIKTKILGITANIPLQATKEWHQTTSEDLRILLVHKLLETVVPVPDQRTMIDCEMGIWINFCKEVEAKIYEDAESMPKYFDLVTEKVFNLQKELDKKRLQKQQQQQQQQEDQQSVNNDKLYFSIINSDRMTHEGYKKKEIMDKKYLMSSDFGSKDAEIGSQINETKCEPSQSSSSSSTFTKKKCPIQPDTFQLALLSILDKLIHQEPESIPFRQPVPPLKYELGVPDYEDIIKKPMDLSTIQTKLEQGRYPDPWEFVDDVRLMFDNAWFYNSPTTRTYFCCSKLAKIFEAEIDSVMKSLGYCCGRLYKFKFQTLTCSSQKKCSIPKDAKYYSYQSRHTTTNYCQKCFNEIQEDTITMIGDDPTTQPIIIKKDLFVEKENVELLEPFVECQECGRKFHQICVLHLDSIWGQGFTCHNCLKQNNIKKKHNPFTAQRLPTTKLGIYIENRVNNFLKKEKAAVGAGRVYIRVVSSIDKIVAVKPEMKNRLVETGHLPPTFPYRAKTLLAFQVIDGVEVCFFGMLVQEYGSECPAPNTRRVYIAYIDSVHFFKPGQLRTAVYHEILLGYLQYVKQLGYTMAHIWACPPPAGDYIFHCHPKDQKIPNSRRLQQWYLVLFEKGMMETIIVDYKNKSEAMKENLTVATNFPYFEGDFWPTILEESMKALDRQEKRRQTVALATTQKVKMEIADAGENRVPENCNKLNADRYKKRKAAQTGNGLPTTILAILKKHTEVFFVIRLHPDQATTSLGTIKDPDPCRPCILMDSRDEFLNFASLNNHEFSSLRRAKFSTMAMLYELHRRGQDGFVYTCDKCKRYIDTRYHCTVCADFDLCPGCFQKYGHPHTMDKFDFYLVDEPSSSPDSDQSQTKPQEASNSSSVQRCLQSLVHACQCKDDNCGLRSCHKMKRVFVHVKVCRAKTKIDGGCPICKQMSALCSYHATHCLIVKCPLPFCVNFKEKIDKKQAQQRLEQRQILDGRMPEMMQMEAFHSNPMIHQPVRPHPSQLHPVPGNGGGKPGIAVIRAAFEQRRESL